VIEELRQVLGCVGLDSLPNLVTQIGQLSIEVSAGAGRLLVVAVASDVVGGFVHEVRYLVGVNETATTFPGRQIGDSI